MNENPFHGLDKVKQNALATEQARLDAIRKDAREKHKLLFSYFDPLISKRLEELNSAMGWNATLTRRIAQEQAEDPVSHADSAGWALQWKLQNSKTGGIDHYEFRVGWSRFYVPAGYNNGIDESSVSVLYYYRPNYSNSKDFRDEFIMKDGNEFHKENDEKLVNAIRSVVQNAEAYVGLAQK